ncbi:MAG: transposase [Lachnospiraceae bacterium]|nr:transposase [Lachnospiraceae bacterium]
MLNRLADNAQHIVISVKLTDFRKQIDGLVAIVSTQFRLDPYSDIYFHLLQ